MDFSYDGKREWKRAAQRSVAMAPRGMLAASQHLATLTGYRILAKGGNAVDAAVGMVITLSAVEPHSVGIGGDAFALLYLSEDAKLVGLNGSGRAPAAADLAWFHEHGLRSIPERGILSVTVPGALHSWAQAVERYGNLKLSELFEDAIYYAEHGFPVTEVIAGEWQSVEGLLRAPESAFKSYLIEGNAPKPGQVFRNPDLARTYEKIARDGIGVFYEGEIGESVTEFCQRMGGLLALKDLRAHRSTWVEPISSDYRGYTICELPPNGQGATALEMLNILQGYDVGSLGHNTPEHLHLLIEAKKIAFSDRDYFITDPEFEDVPLGELLSKEYAEACRGRISARKAMLPTAPLLRSQGTDTVYVTAVDEQRNAASLISSIYSHFGSGMVVDGTGIVLQNRAHSFSLEPGHPNRLEPGKRPMHTIIPGMVFKDGDFLISFGVMGADMQPQGHVQFLMNLIDFKMNLQEALDAPRIRHMHGLEVRLEDGIPPRTASSLQEKGHRLLQAPPSTNQWGGGQAIYLDRRQDVLLGASDRRKDGCAIGY